MDRQDQTLSRSVPLSIRTAKNLISFSVLNDAVGWSALPKHFSQICHKFGRFLVGSKMPSAVMLGFEN